jgi:WD40 repeat protein
MSGLRALAVALLLAAMTNAYGGPQAVDLAGDSLPSAARARLGSPRLWHGPAVSEVLFTPDGKSLFSCGDEPFIRLWETATGKEIRAFAGHEGSVLTIAVRPDGRILASAGEDKTVRLWEVATGLELRRWQRESVCACVDFAPDGQRLAMAMRGDKPIVSVWDLNGDKESTRFTFVETDDRANIAMRGFRGSPYDDSDSSRSIAVAYAPDGRHLLSSRAGRIYWCDLASGKKVRRYDVPEPAIVARLAPDGQSLAAGGQSGAIYRWETSSMETLPAPKYGEVAVQTLAFARDGGRLAASGPDGSVRVMQIGGDGTSTNLRSKGAVVRALAFSADGKTLATGEMGGAVRLWNVEAGKERLLAGQRPAFVSVAFSADGAKLLSAEPGRVRCWDVRTGKELQSVALPESAAEQYVLSPDAGVVAIVEHGAGLTLLDTATGRELAKVATGGPLLAPVFAPDSKSFAFAAMEDGFLTRLVATSTGRELRRIATTESTATAATVVPDPSRQVGVPLVFTPDGSVLVCGGPGRLVTLWETLSGKQRRRLRTGINPLDGPFSCRGCALSPDGRFLTRPQAESIAIVDLVNGKTVRRMDGHEDDVTCLAVSPDGRLLASGSSDRSVRLWDIANGTEKSRLAGHRGEIRHVAFSPDGKTLVSTSMDGTALAWDVSESISRGVVDTQTTRRDSAIELLWARLADEDAALADNAIRELVAVPKIAVAGLASHLRPIQPAGKDHVRGLLRALDSPRFAEREQATRELSRLEGRAIRPLRRLLDSTEGSAESRRRAEAILEEIDGHPPEGEQLRETRAVEVLEAIGDAAARRLLSALASGDPDARLTRRAKEALTRLAIHSGPGDSSTAATLRQP